MTRMLNGHLVRDPHAETDAGNGKFECQTVREAVLEASAELAEGVETAPCLRGRGRQGADIW